MALACSTGNLAIRGRWMRPAKSTEGLALFTRQHTHRVDRRARRAVEKRMRPSLSAQAPAKHHADGAHWKSKRSVQISGAQRLRKSSTIAASSPPPASATACAGSVTDTSRERTTGGIFQIFWKSTLQKGAIDSSFACYPPVRPSSPGRSVVRPGLR